jgi:H2-forming N5,N10-methylenetetrahydromethanopterin dehydrogenase-like enzyme
VQLLKTPEMIGIFASKMFHQKVPKNGLVEELTPTNRELLVNQLKSLFAKTDLSALNSADKISALKEYYNFSEQQIKTIKSGLELNNSVVLDTIISILHPLETDIEEISEEAAILPRSLMDALDLKTNARFTLYKDVIDDINSCFQKKGKNVATIKLIYHLLPKVKDFDGGIYF